MNRSIFRRLLVAGSSALALSGLFAAGADAALNISAGIEVPPPNVTAKGGYAYAYDDATGQPARIEIVRGGAVVASNDFGGINSFDLQSGDVVRASRNGAELASVTFDGTPSFDASVCDGQTAFTGKRSASGSVTDVYAYKYEAFSRYGRQFYRTTDRITGDVTGLNGDAFSGTFRKALTKAHIVSATQKQTVGATTYYSSIERQVTDCPQPPAPVVQQPPPAAPPALKDLTAPTGKLTLPSGKSLTVANLFDATGLTDEVTISEPGVVTQGLFLDNGAKPTKIIAAAAAKKRKKAKKKVIQPVLIASGKTVAKVPGKVKVTLKATKAAKKKYRKSRKLKVVLVTRVTDLAGNVKTLPIRKLVLKKK